MALDGRLVANIGVLAAIVEGGSFARAADSLGLSPSGVSRAVARLESRVGVRLLDRTTRSVTLTDEGRRLYGEIGPLLSGIENAFTHTAGSAAVVRGRLRVNVDSFFSRRMLAAHAGRFLQRYPEVSLDLVSREQLGDLVGEGFDIAVRFGHPPSSSLIARKLLETSMLTVAAPAYVRKHGRPREPADLLKHECIQMRNTLTGEPLSDWEFRQGRRKESVKTGGRLLGHGSGHAARRLPRWRRHRAHQGNRRAGFAGEGPTGRASAGMAGRNLPALRALPLRPPARGQGSRLHRVREGNDRGTRPLKRFLLPDFGQKSFLRFTPSADCARMSDLSELQELIAYLVRTTSLSHGEATRVVGDVLAYLSETPESYVRRRHLAMQGEGLSNPEIFARLQAELAQGRFRAPELTERQIRRIIYG